MIHEYCAKGQVEKFKEIVRNHRQGININASDKNGNIPLHLAITRNQLKIVTLIASEFKDEVDTSLRDSEGYDALDLAITKNSVTPGMIVHQVLKITNRASLSSLTLALKTDQDNLIDQLISKIPDSLFTPDPSLIDVTMSRMQRRDKERRSVLNQCQLKSNLYLVKYRIYRFRME